MTKAELEETLYRHVAVIAEQAAKIENLAYRIECLESYIKGIEEKRRNQGAKP